MNAETWDNGIKLSTMGFRIRDANNRYQYVIKLSCTYMWQWNEVANTDEINVAAQSGTVLIHFHTLSFASGRMWCDSVAVAS